MTSIREAKIETKSHSLHVTKTMYWCNVCSVPLLQNNCNNCGSIGVPIGAPNLKPVFIDEFKMFKDLLIGNPKFDNKYIPWIMYRKRNYLVSEISEGSNFASYNFTSLGKVYSVPKFRFYKDKIKRLPIRNQGFYLNNREYLKKLINANLDVLERIESEAIEFIKETIDKYRNHSIATSFSGGKDSLVTTSLLSNATKSKFNIIFVNTGIELPETVDYIESYIPKFGNLIHLKPKNDFFQLISSLDPPSRLMRWCCFTQKGAPVNDYYSKMNYKILSFDGIRRGESRLRKDYPRIKQNTKIVKQLSVYPIIDWSEFEVWLYILWKKLKYNPVYDKGFSRCGCWACPNNGRYDWYLLKKFYPKYYTKWKNILEKYAEDEGRYDSTWVKDGAWKSRRVRYNDEIVGHLEEHNDPFLSMDSELNHNNNISFKNEKINEHKICLENNDLLLNLNRKVNSKIIEFLKPFGKLKNIKIKSKNFTIINGRDIIIKIPDKTSMIKIEILNELTFPKIKRMLERQIIKALNCVDCASCTNSCKHGAIMQENKKFQIDENLCNNCLECCTTKYISNGCVALHYKSKRKTIEKKSN